MVLRTVACLLVVYCHLIGYAAKPAWFVKPYIDEFIRDPLAILTNFGYLGVTIFFIISGLLITHVAQRETRIEFAIKRLFRIYPPFLAAVAVAVVLAHLFDLPEASLSTTDLLWEASLFGSQFKMISASYTLVMELMFYAIVAAILPLVRSRPIVATAMVAILPVPVQLMLRDALPAAQFPQLAILLAYQNFLSVFAIGMAIYYAWSERISIKAAVALGSLAWCAFVWTCGPSPASDSFPINTLYAVAIFLAVLWANPRVNARGAVATVSEESYSLYLLHVPVGGLILDRLEPRWGYTTALVICLVFVAISSWLSYAYIEKPSQQLGRLLIRRWSCRDGMQS